MNVINGTECPNDNNKQLDGIYLSTLNNGNYNQLIICSSLHKRVTCNIHKKHQYCLNCGEIILPNDTITKANTYKCSYTEAVRNSTYNNGARTGMFDHRGVYCLPIE